MTTNYDYGTWTNFGDISPYHGQLWINNATVDNDSDYAECVEIINCREHDGPENCYRITCGTIYIPDDKTKRESALGVIGETPSLATWIDLALAFHAHAGVEADTYGGITIVQFGKTQDSRETVDPDLVLHGNCKVSKYIRNEYLGGV